MELGIFANCAMYHSEWTPVEERHFNDGEKSIIKEGSVVTSKYGLSAKILFINGNVTYIPLDPASELALGETIDFDKVTVIKLAKEGKTDILRLL